MARATLNRAPQSQTNSVTDYAKPPADLPAPVDDGGADHLPGARLPPAIVAATDGAAVNLADPGPGVTVLYLYLYLYPLTAHPGTDLPDGWDTIPGARGCTPEACAFRDHHADLIAAGATAVHGISSQTSEYQREVVERLNLPLTMLDDPDIPLAETLGLPTFTANAQQLYRRLTMLVRDGAAEHASYPVFPPDQHAQQVLQRLERRAHAGGIAGSSPNRPR